MTREIKFRGKRVDNAKFVYGYYHLDATGYVEAHYITTSDNMDVYEVIPESVGQFTGLRDTNGVEIYEGDILAMGYGKVPSRVFWSEKNASWMTHNITRNEDYELNKFCQRFIEEVIGNIHDNPSLLGVKS